MKKSGLGKNIFLFAAGLMVIILSIILYLIGSFQNFVVIALDIVGAICVILGLTLKPSENTYKINVKDMTIIAVMGAFSIILYVVPFLKFNLPIFPTFLDFHFSEIPALITGFAYGPIPGMLVILVRFICKLPMTSTAGVGEIGDLILGLIIVLISSLIYQKHKTFKGAITGMGIAVVLATLVACLINAFILVPFYVEFFFQGNIDGIIAMCAMIPNINSDNFMTLYLLVGVVPFNLCRFIIVYIITILLYKRLHILFNYISHGKKKNNHAEKQINGENK